MQHNFGVLGFMSSCNFDCEAFSHLHQGDGRERATENMGKDFVLVGLALKMAGNLCNR